MIKICKHCGKEFETQKHGTRRQYCYDCNSQGELLQGNMLRKRMKLWALEYKGAKCEKCGYNHSISALEFHHLDPSQKDFTISSGNLSSDWAVVKEELDKCILLCANCHREEHEQIQQNQIILNLEEKLVDNAKRVKCINTNQIFGSCQLAGLYFGINAPAHIKEVCNGKRHYCGKHPETQDPLIWEWVDITEEEKKYFNNKKKELLISSQNKQQNRINKLCEKNAIRVQSSTGEIFNSLKEAAEWCKISYQSLGRALKNENFTAGQHPITKERLHWKRITKEGDDIIELPN